MAYVEVMTSTETVWGDISRLYQADYFNHVNGANLEDNQDLFKLISNIGHMLGFKPIVIECHRNKLDRAISALFHDIYNCKEIPDGPEKAENLHLLSENELINLLMPYMQQVPISQTITMPDNIIHIKLRIEEKHMWAEQLAVYGITDYTPIDVNINYNHNYTLLKDCANKYFYDL